MRNKLEIIEKLAKVIESRKCGDLDKSYVARLFAKGQKKIAQKVGEEAVELVIAAARNNREEAVLELGDLMFHLMVLWSDMGITIEDVCEELASREGLSGIDEKEAREDFNDVL